MLPKFVHCLLLVLVVAAGPAPAADAPLWFDAGRPAAGARQAVEILASAAAEGLDPSDYDAAHLGRRVAQALAGPALADAPQAQLDAALTNALQHYLADLKTGRVNPQQVQANFMVQRDAPLDTAAFLREAVAERRLAEALRQAAPPLPMYASLRQALARYRELANHPAWQTALPPLPASKVVASRAYAGLPVLAQRLEALGDLPAGAPPPLYLEGALLTALQAFQERHGLAPNGVLDPMTLQQLNVAPASRVRQIELTMERLRWTPFLQKPRLMVVNVPEFLLRAYEVRDGQMDVKLTMKVIVGKARGTPTPLFGAAMRFIEFSPYWNVPPSIARKELVPRLRRDPAHFEQQGFEFVTANGQVVTLLSEENLDAVLGGGWRIRQRPGPRNALGDIKFVFPNKDNIYLHHTPALQLFERVRRDFSHGCIRVEAPLALAQFVLQDEPAWTEDRIRQAMAKGESSTLRLAQPLPVLIAYNTVVVTNGQVFFYPDLYGNDRLLDQALRQHSAALTPSRLPDPGAR